MRPRFHIALITLFSLLAPPALLAQSQTRKPASKTRRTVESKRESEASTRKSTARSKRAAPEKGESSRTRGASQKSSTKQPSASSSTTKKTRTSADSSTPKSTPKDTAAVKAEPAKMKAKPTAKSGVGSLAAADQAYFKKNYATALRLYQEALKQRAVSAERRPTVDYRVARCLGFMERWDAAITESARLSSRYPNTIWDARSKSWLMRLYLKAPHVGWKVGDRYYRGADAPETDASNQPQQVDLTPEDWRKAALYGEQSKSLYEKLRDETRGTGEEADMTSDLAKLIAGTQVPNWAEGRRWKSPADDAWKLEPSAPYDPAWAPPKKVLQLYLSAEEVGTKAQKPLARLAQATWLRSYQSLMARVAWREEPSGERKPIPYPYQDRSAPEVLRTLTRDYPESATGDYALYQAGRWLNQDGRYNDALEVYEALAKARPDTRWAQAAKSEMAAITRAVLAVEPPKPQAPGKKALLSVKARNVPSLKFTAYSLKLEDVVKDGRVLSRPRAGISELLARIGKSAGLKKFYQGDPVAWELPLTPKTEHDWTTQSVETPLTRNGAYAVEIEGGPVRSTAVLLISDLAAIQLVDRTRAAAMVVNAETGAPVVDAQVLIREVYTDPEKKQRVSAATSTSNADGLAEKPLAPKRLQSDDVMAFAWKGDRYAFTSGTRQGLPPDRAPTFAYVYTDRPSYRPGQVVQFRALLVERGEDGTWKPLAGEKAQVSLSDPKEAVTATLEVTSNQFGTVQGKLTLPSQAPLGTYDLIVAWGEKEHRQSGRGYFSVEEYRKPEFAVTIAPGAGPARVGEPLQARISARYYFGAPVANARVKYEIIRSEWFTPFPFHGNSSGLSDLVPNLQSSLPGSTRRWNFLPYTPPVTGTATTDANGEVLVPIDTRVADPEFQGRHLAFTVTAEVTDSGRRTVQANGELRALATQFGAYVRPTRGFVSAGEPLIAEIQTVDAAGQPVAASGTGRVLRVFAEGDEFRTEEVFAGPARTDRSGSGTFTWALTRPGRYLVRFEALDAWEQRVTAVAETWVAGDSAGEGVSTREQVRLIAEFGEYRPGQKARLLVVGDQPNPTLLLAQATRAQPVELRVVRIEGRSGIVEVPLDEKAFSRLAVSANGVRRRRFFSDRVDLVVTPRERLLSVEVTPNRSIYKPGEQATFNVRTRNAAGQPVSAEVGVGVSDASIDAIAGTRTTPIQSALFGQDPVVSLSAQESLSPVFDAAEEDQQPPLKQVRPQSDLPGGLGNIEAELLANLPGNWGSITEEAPPEFTDAGADQPQLAKGGLGMTGPAVRTQFADTAFWAPGVVTDANGEATVTFKWPDNLTRWKVEARGWSQNGQVGETETAVTTAKDLLVRLQAPRFFVERDELVLSANVHNYTQTAQKVKVTLQLEGQTLVPAGSAEPGPPMPRSLNVPRADRPGGAITFAEESASPDSLVQTIDLPAGAEQRVDWPVRVERPGEAKIRVLAEAEADSDAVELTFPVLPHGVEKRVIKSGAILGPAGDKSGARSAKVTVTVPAERAPDAGELVVQVSPSAGTVMIDALPYLADYPYGCTEQTLSRFMPTVVSAKALQDLGLDLDVLRKRVQQGAGPGERGKNPVFDPKTLKKMTAEGLERLRQFQHANGGWGWWEGDPNDDQLTAYVLQGLLAGKEAGVAIPAPMLERGMTYLEGRFAGETNSHERVYEGWVLSQDRKRAPAVAKTLLESVYPKRDRLTAYGLALLALTLKNGGHTAEARTCMENLENTARIDKEAGTCSWTRNLGTWWEWYNQDVETTAACLRVFNALEPKHRLAPMVVRWLANNRIGASWSSTRDTALAVYALAEYVKGQHELAPDYTVTVDVGGRQKKSFRVTAENALTFDNRLVVPATALGSGAQEITVTREGEGNVYFTAALRYFTLEEGIKSAGSELRVRRRYYRLTRPAEGSKEEVTKDGYVRTAVNAGDHLNSGDLIEVELLVESKNAYEQLVFEDMKPSGCEPVELHSGTRYGGGLCSNLELRDDRVAFFVTALPQGKRLLSYRLRAETPGSFHALPLTAYAMYAPAVRCISDEGTLSIDDKPTNKP